MSSREAVIDALFKVLTEDATYQTTGRRLISWSQINEQPALFLRHVADELDGVETALKPVSGIDAQTLRGLVTHCWIEGRVEIHPGDLDGQAIAVVPIKMLVPTIL